MGEQRKTLPLLIVQKYPAPPPGAEIHPVWNRFVAFFVKNINIIKITLKYQIYICLKSS